MAGVENEYLDGHRQFRLKHKKISILFPVFAVIVAILVFWWLKLVGITITGDTFCDLEEHSHIEECYLTEYICSFSEADGTSEYSSEEPESSSEASDDTDTTSTSEASDDTDTTSTSAQKTHIHTQECSVSTLICSLPEHTHSPACFPDKSADVETVGDWLKSFEQVTITNDVAENLVAIAGTQKGYRESELNYEFDEQGIKRGYTRYGEWYGNPYAKWNVIFVSFCLNYSNANNSDPLEAATAENMRLAWTERGLYASADSNTAEKGDIVFFDNDSDGKADRVAIVTNGASDIMIVIEGDVEGKVDSVPYSDLSEVMGYGRTGELYAQNHISDEETTSQAAQVPEATEDSGTINNYIPQEITSTVGSESDNTTNEATSVENNSEEPTTVEDSTEESTTVESSTEESTTEQASTEDSTTIASTSEEEESDAPTEESTENQIVSEEELNDLQDTSRPDVFNSEPLMMFSTSRAIIDYTSHLEGEVIDAVFKDQQGNILGDGSVIYIGQSYVVSLEFSEINTGNTWIQFRHNEDGYLTYHIPSNLHCEEFTSWHPISATAENGTIEDVGRYFVDASGLLRVEFFEDENGVNFVEKYANVDFTIDFNATVGSTQSGETTEVVFGDKVSVELTVDGSAEMNVTKTHGSYDSETNTMDYTIKVETTKGVIRDLIIDDQIWDTHYTLRDSILVTDLNGNVLDPQPIVSDHPSHNNGAEEGFRISGFPDCSAGNGFLITYKTKIYDELLSNESVGLWNGLDTYGKNGSGGDVYVWADDWTEVELEKIEKDGKQSVLEDENGNLVPVIEWEIEIIKNNHNLQGTVVIDTLGDGLDYYENKSIRVKRYDENGERLSDIYISWNDVTVNGNTMSFPLPDGYAFDIIYYTTYTTPAEGETANYTNSVKATINGKEETAGGSADVIGFIPHIVKSAHGNDGEYVYFTIEADVPAVIKDWGHFFLTDLTAFWGYDNDVGYLYVENKPQDIVITAQTESGQTITFTPYTEGGTVENTYMLISPAEGDQEHSFNILFNTADPTFESSKWILNEDSKLTITYKIPFDAKTGVEWEGELTGDLTLEDVLLSGKKLANEAYLNYTEVIRGTGATTYDYSPKIIKKSVVNEDGTINYTVVFNNSIPGTSNNSGYVDATVDKLWFIDTFDERLEYVPDSLIVTGYSPWQQNLWLAKYKYSGTVTGNTINAYSRDLLFYDYNEDADAYGWNGLSGTSNFRNYYRWVDAGGRFEFTYTLRVKDEYLYTTDHSKFILDNTAEITWDETGSSGPVTEKSEYETGLIDKHVVQKDSKLDFDIHVNRRALDILEGSDTLTIEDTMTPNISVYWNTIKLLYLDNQGNWVDFTSPESEYTYSVTYDPPQNKLTFVIPDSLHIRIDYTTLITESGTVSVENSVRIDGKAEVSDFIDSIFRVQEHSGGASGSVHNITLLKQDGTTDHPLPNAVFLLYGPMGDPNAVLPSGASRSIIADNGSILYYIGSYTTGTDGTVIIETQYLTLGGPYALVETVAPVGYNLPESPTYFYFYETDPDGIIQTVTTLIAIENFSGGFLIPETGGMGIFPLATVGFALAAFPILYSTIRRKKERRLT